MASTEEAPREEHPSKQKQDGWERYEPACYSTAQYRTRAVVRVVDWSTERERAVRAYSVTGGAAYASASPLCAALLPRRARRCAVPCVVATTTTVVWGCERLMQVVSLGVITTNENGLKVP
jgi:hypothetical protein